jgi:hypothetical protein
LAGHRTFAPAGSAPFQLLQITFAEALVNKSAEASKHSIMVIAGIRPDQADLTPCD